MSPTCEKTIPAFCYAEGRLQPLDIDAVPRWALPALAPVDHSDDLAHALALNDAECVEKYGEALEGLDIWYHQGSHMREWCAVYWSNNQQLALIVIHGTKDFLEFQSNWCAKLAIKIMSSDMRHNTAE